MLFHYGIIGFGWLGVQLFFVLSGFLITGILLKLKHEQSSFTDKIKRFYARRSLRIFPVYYLYLFVFLLCFLLFHFPADFVYKAPYLFTYTYNYSRTFEGFTLTPYFTHLWSLCVEEQFYLVWPFIVLLTSRKNLKRIMLLFVILIPVFRYILFLLLQKNPSLDNGDIGDAVYWNTISQADAFAIGGLVSVVISEGKIIFQQWFVYITAILFLLYGICMSLLQYGADAGNYLFNLGYPSASVFKLAPVFSYSIANLFFASCIFFLADAFIRKQKSVISTFLSTNVLVQVGKVSYGMYIYHWAIMMLLKRYASWKNSLVNFPIYLAIVFAVAYLSYRFFESFFLKWKLRFA